MKKLGVYFIFVFTILTVLLGDCKIIEAKTKDGFTYDEDDYNVEWRDYESLLVCTDKGGVLGTLSYRVGLAREKGSNNYIVMMKEVMTPNDKKVKINSLNQRGYGLSEYLSVKTTLPGLDDYQPQNAPGTDTVELGIGAGKDGPSVAASYDIKTSELDITSKCDTPKKIYQVVYDYKPHIPNVLASNKYLANESVQMGLAEFSSKKKEIKFKVSYMARFGAAGKKSRAPAFVYIDYVRTGKVSREYTFKIKK